MTGRARFGGFATAASRHLDNLPRPGAPFRDAAAPADQAEELTRSMRGMLAVMTRYADGVSRVMRAVPPADRRQLAPWIRAASRTSESLQNATSFLQPGPPGAGQTGQPRSSGPAARGLDAAARSMTLARDLLHTHIAARPGGDPLDRSEWAPAVTSVPVTRALLYQLAGWARQIAIYGGQAAVTSVPGTPKARRQMNAACQWLWVLDWAVQAAHEQQPVTADDIRLLHAIPVNALAPRHQPTERESVSSLCQGTIDSAERIREAASAAIAEASWSPRLTMESLRQTAGYCTVISCNCESVLHTLVGRAAHDRTGDISARLAESSAAAGKARLAWLGAAAAWDRMTTDTRDAISPAAAEAADLALWTGRLAYADPAWNPEYGPSPAARTLETLAPEPGDLPRVLAAVHHTCETLSQLAAADHSQLQTASRMGRLVVPTRSLPESYDVPYRFAPAPGSRVEPLLTAYHNARTASDQATADVAGIASTIRAHSHIVLTIRAAAQNDPRHPTGQKQPPGPPAPPHPSPELPGPVERILRDLDVTSPAQLQRASAIDRAAETLILESAQTRHRTRPRADARNLARSAATAELINHILAPGDSRIPSVLRPPEPQRPPEAEIEP